MQMRDLWRAALERLRSRLMAGQFAHWIQPAWLAITPTGEFVLCTRTPFAKQLLEHTFRAVIEATIEEITRTPCRLEVVVVTRPASAMDG